VSNSAIKFVCFLSREFSFALYNNKCGMQRLSESVREIFSAFNFIVYILCQGSIGISIAMLTILQNSQSETARSAV